jgi:hypothetical protein
MDLNTFEQYKEAVISAYKQKKSDNTLSRNLVNHTPANLKNECVNELPTKYSEDDRETFKALFGKAESKEEYFQKVRLSDPDIFRPLNNFLRGNTDQTHSRNIELLAWLINFKPRPFYPAKLIDPPVVIGPDKKTWSKMKTIVLSSVIIACLVIVYILVKPRAMYWNGDEFKTVALYQNFEGRFIVELDTFRLAHQRKIRDYSKITRNSIGKVHYSRINNIYTFYTIGGENPDDTTRRLRPLSEVIWNKHVLHK